MLATVRLPITYFVRFSNDDVYMVPPMSICTGAVSFVGTAGLGTPVSTG